MHNELQHPTTISLRSDPTPRPPLREKVRGQTTVVIGLCMLALIGVVGLAVDGGSIYAQRRVAQNASDGAALAGARTMLNYYESMAANNTQDVDGTADQEDAIRTAISQYAGLNGVITSTLKAYFVNDNKQLVTVPTGEGGCGVATVVCQVGKNGRIPWSYGAKGVMVTTRAQTNSFFFKIFGWDRIGATAPATAYMGVAVDSNPDVSVFPVGFFTDTNGVGDLNPGQTYVLIDGDSRYSSGNWGYVNYNSYGGASSIMGAWLDCGYKPSLITQADWDTWCTFSHDQGRRAYGPTEYWTGATSPDNGPFYAPRLQWGDGATGWWIAGSTGTALSNCNDLSDILNVMDGSDVLIPIFDMVTEDLNGNNTKFHMLTLGLFHIQNSVVDCHVNEPGGGQHAHWHIEGIFEQTVAAGSSGTHGDLRHNSLHIVFLEH